MAKHKDKFDMQEIMEIYKKVGTPGEPHKAAGETGGKLDNQVQGLDGTRQAADGIDRHVRTEADP